jgi:ectoine hydroxylase-related dioxygenase (phytanoyl-CoA dioxygenase family)
MAGRLNAGHHSGMLTPEQIRQFHDVGYLRGPRVLDDDEVEVLREETLRVIRDRDRSDVAQPVLCHNMTGKADAVVWQIVNIWMASEPFKRAVTSERVSSMVAQLTGARELRVWHDQIQYKPAGAGGVNMWHQDSPYWDILTPKHQQVTAWIALDDVDVDNGCMKMVPGSHHWGSDAINYLHTLKNFDDMEQVTEWRGNAVKALPCPVARGEVHFHHSLTWHGSGANKSGRPRRAIAIHYATDQTKYRGTGTHIMKKFVTAGEMETLTGDAFPVVWSSERDAAAV